MNSRKKTQGEGASSQEDDQPTQRGCNSNDANSEKHDAVDEGADEEHGGMGQTMLEPEAIIAGAAIPSDCVISRQSTRASQRTVPPPDGGLRAWSACICAHVVIANTWGLINSFGIFQAYYTDFLQIPPSQISWIGSLQIFLANFLAVFSGRLTDAGYFRTTIAAGTVLQTLGAFATSFCTQYWQLVLAQGVVIGAAAGLLCCPMLSVTSTYFSSRRALAVGIVTCGNVTGGLIYPAMARQLLPTIGFGWSLRAMAFLQVATMIVVNIVARPRIKTKAAAPMIDWATLKELDFVLYGLGIMFSISGTYVALYYIPQFSRTQISPTLSYPNSLNLLLIFNGISVFGRIIPSQIADTVGPINVMIPAAMSSGLCCFGWTGVTSPGGMYAWTTVFALVGTAPLALFPAGVMSLAKDLRNAGARMGMAMAISSVSVLVGPPVAGAIITRAGGSYKGAQVYGGCLLLLGASLLFGAKAARKVRTGGKWITKI